ncbi:DNA-binding IclR family transcriptional regulator [Evansella vedderi]|uniref:DNA-binding IclR family transcriptional regulator n=1 Tax=Evansella vedderi TaxID=38282 RepID=A0ABT9ZPZ3_9BACI|nr:IclR family transcriptional regulator [Evansella vedderi]MDQ0253307.1 DNA-binding IclR family transcriptional regulator [Evansella vedderi]
MKEVNVKSIRSVERALSVLNCFLLERKKLTFKEILEMTGLPRTTLYRILFTLEKEEYLVYDKHLDEYRLSMRFFHLGMTASESGYSYKAISPFLDELKSQVPHTILIAGLSDRKLIYLDKRESTRELKVGSEIGQVRNPDYSILGKVILAFLEQQELTKIIDDLKGVRSEEEISALLVRLEEIRRTGYASAWDETTVGVAGVAVPIFNQKNEVVVSLGVLSPSAGLEEGEFQRIIDLTVHTAFEISSSLGFRKDGVNV